MNAATQMMTTHPIASTWLALTFCLWIVIYAKTASGNRAKARVAARARSDQA